MELDMISFVGNFIPMWIVVRSNLLHYHTLTHPFILLCIKRIMYFLKWFLILLWTEYFNAMKFLFLILKKIKNKKKTSWLLWLLIFLNVAKLHVCFVQIFSWINKNTTKLRFSKTEKEKKKKKRKPNVLKEVRRVASIQESIPFQCIGPPKGNGDQIAPHNYYIWSNVSNEEDDITCMSHNTSPSQDNH